MSYEPESEWLLNNGLVWKHSTGVYVDLGAAHPINHSLTSFVRDLGWRGVAVDGNYEYTLDWENAGFRSHFFPGLLSDQPEARFAVHNNSFTSRISPTVEHDRPDLWGINRIEERDCLSLNYILQRFKIEKINLLTCDLEGMEARVLATLDWEKHQPSFVIVEYITEGLGIDCAAVNLLISKGYELIQMFPSNMIFKRK